MKNAKIFLEENMRYSFKEYTRDRINKGIQAGYYRNHMDRDWDKLDIFFNHCFKHSTWADHSGKCIVAGEEKAISTNQIFCNDGRVVTGIQNIIDYSINEYKNDSVVWIEENIYHNMFCQFEWLTRGKDDFAQTEYNKIFKKAASERKI